MGKKSNPVENLVESNPMESNRNLVGRNPVERNLVKVRLNLLPNSTIDTKPLTIYADRKSVV